MSPVSSVLSAVTLALALSSFSNAATLQKRDDASYGRPPVTCTNFGPPDEFYYKESGHSSPLYGVEINNQGILTAVRTKDTNVTFQFEKCDAPSTGYIQGEPITKGYAGEYFGHVRHVASGKCLHWRGSATRDFDLGDCPTVDTAAAQLPFWFENPSAKSGVVRFTGYKNTTAYPQPIWFQTGGGNPPFAPVTNVDGAQGKPNQWVLAFPIRV